MWPQALQMTRDECRGILRRLELESYSHVISVFRAQGGLSENKAKLLEELRNIFHISQERHRAEARRVANDEQLSTIAEAISGPNTWQEWSREGRRSFPMLPRVAPQTALALIANSVAVETAAENAKLPYPSETAAPVAAEQAAHAAAKSAEAERKSWNIVASDPFKVPEIPSQIPKKPLKRNLPDSQNASIKRRIVNDSSSSAKVQQQHQQQKLKQQQSSESGPTINSSNIRKLYNNHSKLQQQQKVYQQQMHKQKLAAKKNGTQTKRQPNAKGKRAQILKEQQQQVQQSQIQPQQPPDGDQQHATYASKPIDVQMEASEEIHDATHVMPQIAASKKDISKNLTKLHIPLPTGATTACQISASSRVTPIESTSTSASATVSSITSNAVPSKNEKQLISTPVQKYIVEDRQSPAVQVSSPQIMTLPQLSAAASKLRTMNTTILPPGTKITKRLPATTVLTTTGGAVSGSSEQNSNQPQVFNIIEGTTITTTTATSTAHPSTPTHTPPAVIQLNSNNLTSTVNSTDSMPTTPTQGKVLTTKLLPIVLSGTGAHNKIETLNNGATIVAAGGGSTATGATSSVFKTIPSSMLVSTSGSNTNIISTSITSGTHTVFRKPPNIIKTGIIGVSSGATTAAKITSTFNANTSLSGTGTQILSNIKLTPAVVSTTASTTTPQFLKNVTTSGIRTSVKICQSPNGKMFIQPANADALKSAKLQTSLQQKMLPNQSSATSGASTATTPQRIAIQKVQIIPAPMSSPGSIPGTLQLQQQQQKPTSSLSISNKANMIFMPTTCGARGTATISLSKGSISNITPKSQQSIDVSKQNVFVIGAVAQQQQQNQSLKSSVTRENNQMITEDTPVDILNMPIIVDNSSSATSNSVSSGSSTITVNNIGDTVTVLTNDYVESSTGKHTKPQQSSAVVLGVTDWEMELDQATAVAAATKAASTQRRSTSVKSRKSIDQQQKSELQQNTIVVDDNFDDVIVEETFIDEGLDEESQESSTDVDMVMMADNENQTQYVEQYKVTNAQSDDDINIDVVDEDQPQQKRECGNNKVVTDEGTKTSQLIILKSEEENIDETYDEAIAAEMDENTAIEYIEEDHNENFDDDKSNSKLMRVLEETNNVGHVVTNKTSSTTSESSNEVKSLTTIEDDNKNISTCELDEACKESHYELVQTEALEERQSPITTESSSRDEQ